jgi:hypothetical protein
LPKAKAKAKASPKAPATKASKSLPPPQPPLDGGPTVHYKDFRIYTACKDGCWRVQYTGETYDKRFKWYDDPAGTWSRVLRYCEGSR